MSRESVVTQMDKMTSEPMMFDQSGESPEFLIDAADASAAPRGDGEVRWNGRTDLGWRY